jgi:macrolide-specific efflux system membrane fusion protein
MFRTWILICAALLPLAGCSLFPVEEEPLRPPLVEPAKQRIETSEVKRETIIRSTRGTAILESVSTVYHQFTQSGYRLEQLLVAAGDEVKKGDTLAVLAVPGIEIELLTRQIEAERKRQALEAARETGDEDKIRLASMELRLAEMQLEQTEEKWNARELKAEIDGVVTFVDRLEPGDWVEPYKTLVIVSDPTKLQLSFSASNSSQIADVELGMDVNVQFKNEQLIGKVVQTPRSAPFVEDERLRDKYARTLYIDLEQLPENAKIGDMANVEIITAVRENVLVIPKDALRQYFGRTYVHVLEGEQRKEVDVETGLENPTKVEILNGLEEGQIVIHP